jgi:hypothetical protein
MAARIDKIVISELAATDLCFEGLIFFGQFDFMYVWCGKYRMVW